MIKKVKLNLTPLKFRGVLKSGYSLDHIFLLLMSEQGFDIKDFDEPKERALLQGLMRKQLIGTDGKLISDGISLLEYIRSKDEDKLVISKRDENSDFDRWWAAYPGTDTVIHKDKVLYKGSRSLRNNKDTCRVKFNKILAEKEYTADQLIAALEYEVSSKIERSIQERQNKLKYMSNSLTYLTQRGFENFIELAAIPKTSTPSSTEGFTI